MKRGISKKKTASGVLSVGAGDMTIPDVIHSPDDYIESARTATKMSDPRIKPERKFKVGVFPWENKPHRFNAYTLWYNPEWKGCCLHEVYAVNGTEAKKLAIAEHKENCLSTE